MLVFEPAVDNAGDDLHGRAQKRQAPGTTVPTGRRLQLSFIEKGTRACKVRPQNRHALIVGSWLLAIILIGFGVERSSLYSAARERLQARAVAEAALGSATTIRALTRLGFGFLGSSGRRLSVRALACPRAQAAAELRRRRPRAPVHHRSDAARGVAEYQPDPRLLVRQAPADAVHRHRSVRSAAPHARPAPASHEPRTRVGASRLPVVLRRRTASVRLGGWSPHSRRQVAAPAEE